MRLVLCSEFLHGVMGDMMQPRPGQAFAVPPLDWTFQHPFRPLFPVKVPTDTGAKEHEVSP